jgi:PDZ domain-containing protein
MTSAFERRVDPAVAAPPTPSVRSVVQALSGMVASLLVAALIVVPSPYSIEGAGPTFDVLADDSDGNPIISIDGATTYPSSGQLRMTTVAVSHASTTAFSFGAVVRAWLDPAISTYPDVAVPVGYEDEIQQEWISSQEMATVAAMGQLGIDVPATIRIADIREDSEALGKLQVDDVIESVDGRAIATLPELSGALGALTPGDPVTIGVRRGGVDVSETFDTIANSEGKAVMGVFVDPTFDMPVGVNVAIPDVGGPSAGMVFTLAIVDLLTPEDELNGAAVAGTGTISPEGDVGPIGGIDLKMIGARRAGADWFLAPSANCPSVVGHVPDGLRVVSVPDLASAYDAMVAIGNGTADDLPTCS